MRHALGYPPFSTMVRLVIRGSSEPVVAEFATHVTERLNGAIQAERIDARVLGPAPCPFSRLRGNYRFQIQTQSPEGDRLRAAVRAATDGLEPPSDVQWIVDVDPVDML